MNRVALVTGGSSGIGRAIAQELRHRGCTVYTCSRGESDLPDVHHLTADVTDEPAVRNLVQTIVTAEGRLDIVVNNAGIGISGAVEFTDPVDSKRLFEVDFFGVDRVCRAALPVMRRQGCGRILNISSVAAPVPIPFQTYYSAAKAAVSAYCLALDNEVKPYGVRVCALLPGDICTGFTAARKKSPAGDAEYGGRITRSVAVMEKDEQSGMAPACIARAAARMVLGRRYRARCTVGIQYKAVLLLSRLLTPGAVNRIVGWIYAR